MNYFGTGGDGTAKYADLIDLFEQSAADGTPIRQIVGDDPVEFIETFARNYPKGQWIIRERVANLISLVVVVLVALLMGFRSGAGVLAWLGVAGILILFTLSLTWIAVIPGLTASSVDGASAFSYPLIFLPLISSAFVPTDTMPGPLRAVAENQPVTGLHLQDRTPSTFVV